MKSRTERKETIRRYFGDLPIVDAPADRKIILLPSDFNPEYRRNDMSCGIARGLERNGCTHTMILHTRGYADFPDEDGNLRVERFLIEDAVKEVLEKFDATGEVPAGRLTIRLKAPRPSQTLEAQRRRGREYSAKRRKAKMKGEIIGSRTKATERGGEPRVIGQVRDGRGMVQMIYAASQKKKS